MSWTDEDRRNARLKTAQRRWAREDRERGYMNVRPYRPAHKRVRRDREQLKETALMVALLIVGWLCFSALA